MTTPSKIFLEVPVTYGAMIEVLTKLGYHSEFDGKHNRYINEKHNSFVVLAIRPPDETLEKVYAAAYSHLLYLQGVIKEEESLVYMIQKNRIENAEKKCEI